MPPEVIFAFGVFAIFAILFTYFSLQYGWLDPPSEIHKLKERHRRNLQLADAIPDPDERASFKLGLENKFRSDLAQLMQE